MLLSALACVPVQAEDEIAVYANGERVYFDTPPIIVQDRTLVPMRALFETLGADVTWDQDNLHAQAIAPGVLVDITIGEPTMRRSTVEIPIDVPAQIINDRTLIPLRVVSECFGMDVEWDGTNNAVYLTSNGKIQYKEWNEGNFYIGELQDGVANGYGEIYDTETGALGIIGLFQNNDIVEGTYFGSANNGYMGEFRNWLPNGEGMMFFDDDSFIMGSFVDGAANGECSLVYPDGSSIDGTFYNGALSADTTIKKYNPDGYLIYEGECNESFQPDGYGSTFNPNTGLTVYTGFFTNGEYNGYGVLYNDYGYEIYKGTWYNGMTAEQAQYYADMAFDEELRALNEEYERKMLEVYEMQNTDPFTTEWGRSMMASVEKPDTSSSGNVDSFAAANAERARLAEENMLKQMVITQHAALVEQMRKNVESWYDTALQALKTKYGITY